MYKNVIFDIGGVMVDFNPKDFLLERFCNSATEEKVYNLTFGSEDLEKAGRRPLHPLRGQPGHAGSRQGGTLR